jgi:2-polyprenyl-3-methyl-5-hydroxy-6-metoxy-1,4-benzoquinol methylase
MRFALTNRIDVRPSMPQQPAVNDTDINHTLSAFGLAPGALVLDLGCGTGLAARAMARAGYRVVGVDLDEDAVSTARALSIEEKIEIVPTFLVSRADTLTFNDSTFDAVICLDVLHWSADELEFRAIWNEAWRVLKPGGVFVGQCLSRDELPDAVPSLHKSGGWFRLTSGAEWFLPTRVLFDDLLAHGGGTWAQAPVAAATPGAARFAARNSVPPRS